MTIPLGWLSGETSIEEVEDFLSWNGASDLWFLQWQKLVCQAAPGDELRYVLAATEEDAWFLPEDTECWFDSFALVRNGEVIDWIAVPDDY